jgi:hypothetical protein
MDLSRVGSSTGLKSTLDSFELDIMGVGMIFEFPFELWTINL